MLPSRRALSLRTQLTIALVVVAMGTSGMFGYLTYRSAREIIRQDAFRIVGAVAEARRTLLLQILRGQLDRLGVFLEIVPDSCSDEGCFRERTRWLLAREHAEAAVVTRPGASPVTVGPRELLAVLPPQASGVIAQMFRERGGDPFYVISRGQPDRVSVRVVWRAARLDALFGVDPELGGSGETFLADSRGYFLTPPRYASTAGHSHPIEARPMLRCLSGTDGVDLAPDYRGALIIHGFRHVREIGGGCIMAHIDVGEAFAPVRRLENRTLIIAVASGLVALALALLLAGRLARPIASLAASARAIRGGRLDVPIPSFRATRELDELAATFREMARALDESAQVRERFIGILAHDLRNPLSSISLTVEVLRKQQAEASPGGLRAFESLSNSVQRMDRMVSDLLDFARSRRPEGMPVRATEVDLGKLVTAAVGELRSAHPDRPIECQVQGDLTVACDPDRAVQVVTNLVENALRYGSPDRPVTVTVRGQESDVELGVHNWGEAIPAESVPGLFDPFRRGQTADQGAHRGLGLGLYIVDQIVRSHGGRVTVTSAREQGTAFTTRWPRRRP